MQVVRLREMFPHGPGFVLVFDFMLSDLTQVIRNIDKPLTEVYGSSSRSIIICSCYILGTSEKLYDNASQRCGVSSR